MIYILFGCFYGIGYIVGGIGIGIYKICKSIASSASTDKE